MGRLAASSERRGAAAVSLISASVCASCRSVNRSRPLTYADYSYPSRNRRRRAGRADARASAAPGRHRLGHRRKPQRGHVIERVRAGVLEQGTVDLMRGPASAIDCSARACGTRASTSRSPAQRHRIDMAALDRRPGDHHLRPERGRQGSDRRAARDGPSAVLRSVGRERAGNRDARRPRLRFRHDGAAARGAPATSSPAAMDFTASAGRRSRRRSSTVYEREYPFAWLGILAERAAVVRRARLQPTNAGSRCSACGRRSITRLYLQCAPDENIDAWSDDRIWAELLARLAHARRVAAERRADPAERASRRCEASSSSRCATAGCFSPATRRTSCRRPARRA